VILQACLSTDRLDQKNYCIYHHLSAVCFQAPVPVIALVGYTNAGKSTLLNSLTEAAVVAEDKLFATLDPTTRRVSLPSSKQVVIASMAAACPRFHFSVLHIMMLVSFTFFLSMHVCGVLHKCLTQVHISGYVQPAYSTCKPHSGLGAFWANSLLWQTKWLFPS